jgi:hypothetical protein
MIVDPDNPDNKREFFWDGDGSDHINDIHVVTETESIEKEPVEEPAEPEEIEEAVVTDVKLSPTEVAKLIRNKRWSDVAPIMQKNAPTYGEWLKVMEELAKLQEGSNG